MKPTGGPKTVLLTLALVLLAVGAGAWYRGCGPVPDRVERLGAFGIVTHTTRYLAGWNEGRLRSATTEHYSVRHRGRPFPIQGRAGMFGDTVAAYRTVNAVITFPAPEPAFVVNVGDPNNSSWFYLVRETGGRARAEYLGESSGSVAADWIDAPPGDSAGERDLAVHRRRLKEGGRWLLLGEGTVLDTRTLKAFHVEAPAGAFPNQGRRPVAMSPDRRSFVRLGTGPQPEYAPLLIVFDFVAGASYALAVDRRVMRYHEWSEVDAAWLDHHFAWRRGGDGHDRLAPRPDFAPLPHQGRLTVDPYNGDQSYRLAPVKPEMRDTLLAFVARELGAERLRRGTHATTDDLRIGEHTVHVFFAEDQLSVSMGFGTDSRLVGEVARRFDAALRTGRYDGLFLP